MSVKRVSAAKKRIKITRKGDECDCHIKYIKQSKWGKHTCKHGVRIITQKQIYPVRSARLGRTVYLCKLCGTKCYSIKPFELHLSTTKHALLLDRHIEEGGSYDDLTEKSREEKSDSE